MRKMRQNIFAPPGVQPKIWVKVSPLRDNPSLKRAVTRHHIVDRLTLSGVVGMGARFDNR